MILIGDIHSSLSAYQRILNASQDDTLQVGDFGFGWFNDYGKKLLDEISSNNKFIRGNHDNPEECKKHKNYLGDFGFLPNQSLFYLGGAWSFEWYLRKQNVDWWLDEELSIESFEQAYNLYVESKPRIMVTHDCPISHFHENLKKYSPIDQNSVILSETHFSAKFGRFPITAVQLERFFQDWQPELWIHGHHHKLVDCKLNNTRFICLPAIWDNSPKLNVLKIEDLSWDNIFDGPVNAKIVNLR